METIVDILGVKINIVLTDGILIEMLEESKINEVKTIESKVEVDKIGELTAKVLKTIEVKIGEVKTEELNSVAEEVYNSVDEVEFTNGNDTLSVVGMKTDWTFEVSIVVTT